MPVIPPASGTPGLTLAQLRAAVERRTGIAYDAAAATDLINEANRVISTEVDWPWLERVTSFGTLPGYASYDPPGDWLRTISLKLADRRPLQWRSATELADDWPAATRSGTPSSFTIRAGMIVLRPVPDATVYIEHHYYRLDPDLVAEDDRPTMPASFHASIVEYAVYLVLRRARESVRAAEALSAYQGWKQRMLDDARRQAGPAKVRIRKGRW